MRSIRRFRLRGLFFAVAVAATVTTACAPAAPPAPAGNPADFAVNTFSGWVQRWNPCAALHYAVDDRLEPAALATIRSAVAQLSKATAITFVYDGLVAYTPNGDPTHQPDSLVISFAKHTGLPGGSALLAGGNQLGDGGFQSSYSTYNGKITTYQIVKGYAVIDADGYNRVSTLTRNAVLLHELGHAVGLNHAHLNNEIMYPVVSNADPTGYGAGDLAGLRKVGKTQGCIG